MIIYFAKQSQDIWRGLNLALILVGEARFERAVTGFKVQCLTSLATPQWLSRLKGLLVGVLVIETRPQVPKTWMRPLHHTPISGQYPDFWAIPRIVWHSGS